LLPVRRDRARRAAALRRSGAPCEWHRRLIEMMEPTPIGPVRTTDWYRSIAVERVDAAVEPSLGCGRIGTPISGVSSHVLTTFYPGAVVRCAGIFMRGCFARRRSAAHDFDLPGRSPCA
jgi:hypothetical protein